MEEAGRTLLKIVPVEAEVAVVCSWAEKLCWEIANRISNSDFLESVETGDYIADIELAEKGSSGLGSGAFTYSAIVS
jgi:hypothetical protein